MPTTELPPISTSPSVGCSKPAIRRRDVVLPQPDGPRNEWNDPRRMAKLTWSTAATSPNRLVTLTKRMSMSLSVGGWGGRAGELMTRGSIHMAATAAEQERKRVGPARPNGDWTVADEWRKCRGTGSQGVCHEYPHRRRHGGLLVRGRGADIRMPRRAGRLPDRRARRLRLRLHGQQRADAGEFAALLLQHRCG